jgi:hypothetical protein
MLAGQAKIGVSVGEFAPEGSDFLLVALRPMRGPVALPNGYGIVGASRAQGTKDMVTELALDAPADVFEAEPHLGSLAVGAANAGVTSHVSSVSRIIESRNHARIGVAADEHRELRFAARRRDGFPGIGCWTRPLIVQDQYHDLEHNVMIASRRQ